jgi:hypothetical protein
MQSWFQRCEKLRQFLSLQTSLLVSPPPGLREASKQRQGGPDPPLPTLLT